MTTYFIDTSSLSKRYIPEIGSIWIKEQVESKNGNTIVISDLTTIELCSVLSRKRYENQISTGDWSRLRTDFLVHADKNYTVVPIDSQVIRRARNLVDRYPLLRSLDAIQLATAFVSAAIISTSVIFVSSDQRLLSVAIAESFQVDNPLNHP